MKRATRRQEHDLADKELEAARRGVPAEAVLVLRLINRCYAPFVHTMIDAKFDVMDGKREMSTEQAQEDVALVLSNMITETIRHTVPVLDLSAQFEIAQGMVAQIAANLQEDLNKRAQDLGASSTPTVQ